MPLGSVKSNPSKPIFWATKHIICQSFLAPENGSTSGRCLDILRSELVTVPFFSPHPVDGNATSANFSVSLLAIQSDTTTSSHCSSACCIAALLGRLTIGLVAITQIAFIFPLAISSNISIALHPAFLAIVGDCQKRCTNCWCASFSMSKCAAN